MSNKNNVNSRPCQSTYYFHFSIAIGSVSHVYIDTIAQCLISPTKRELGQWGMGGTSVNSSYLLGDSPLPESLLPRKSPKNNFLNISNLPPDMWSPKNTESRIHTECNAMWCDVMQCIPMLCNVKNTSETISYREIHYGGAVQSSPQFIFLVVYYSYVVSFYKQNNKWGSNSFSNPLKVRFTAFKSGLFQHSRYIKNRAEHSLSSLSSAR